ncbi:copper resistance CopC/CopD family protein [Paenibacillus alkaliterrae]
MKKPLSCIALLIMMWACLPSFVSAHAYILQSTPMQDAELIASPSVIRITFTEKIDTKLSSITLQNTADGSRIAPTAEAVEPTASSTLVETAMPAVTTELNADVSADGGLQTPLPTAETIDQPEGKEAEASTDAAATDEETEHIHTEGEHDHTDGHGLMVLLRVLDVLAGAVLAGLLFFRLFIWREAGDEAPFGFTLRAERIVITAAALVWVISGWIRLSMLSEQFGSLSYYTLAAETMIGKIAVLRPAGALLVLLLAFAPVRERLWANRVKLIAVAALIVTFPLTGHAYAAVKDAAAAVAAHAVHMCAAAIWFGGLGGLLSLTFCRHAIDRLNQTATRFSEWAWPSMSLILVSGVWLSLARLSSWRELLSTEYGQLIFAKSCLMLLVLVIAALHTLVFMPNIAKAMAAGSLPPAELSQTATARGLLLGVRIEVLLAISLFVLAGWLSSTSPPSDADTQRQREPFYWHVMGEQAHMSLRMADEEASEEQTVRLDVWLPEGMGAPVSAAAAITPQRNGQAEPGGEQVTIPLELQPEAVELYEYPGFTKYTYLAAGAFVDYTIESLITVDVSDADGNDFHYEKAIGRER